GLPAVALVLRGLPHAPRPRGPDPRRRVRGRRGGAGELAHAVRAGAAADHREGDPMSALDLRVRIEGDGSAVLLLHGFGDALDSFWDCGWAAALAGHQVIAFDARGHGGSPRPSAADAYVDAVRVADALAVLDRAGVER